MAPSKTDAIRVLKTIASQNANACKELELQGKFFTITADIIDYEKFGYKSLWAFLVAANLQEIMVPDFSMSHHQTLWDDDQQSNSGDSECESYASCEDLRERGAVVHESDSDDGLSDRLVECHISATASAYSTQTELDLPWTQAYWPLEVTHLESKFEVWARLADDNGKTVFQALCTELNAAKKWKMPTSIGCGDLCLTMIHQQFYRIQIVSKITDRARCRFIDVGDEKWLQINQIFQCNNQQLLTIPPQAICFALEGFESHLTDFNCSIWMDSYLIDKVIMAKIATTKTEYMNQLKAADVAGIKATMFDTEEDNGQLRNLNEEILKKFCESQSSPMLKVGQCSYVTVTCVPDTAEIYCHNVDSQTGVMIVQHAIQQFAKRERIFMEPQVLEQLNAHRDIYLAMDTADQQYYRVRICEENAKADSLTLSMAKCFYVDYGNTKMIPIDLIFTSNTFLRNYPPQVIAIELAGIDCTEFNVLHIQSLIKPMDKIFVTVKSCSSFSKRAQVEAHKAVNSAKALGSINDFIKICAEN